MFLEMPPPAKGSHVARSLMAGLCIVALSACTSTAPEPAAPSLTTTAAGSSPPSPSRPHTSSAAPDPTSSGVRSPAEPTFSAASIKVLEHTVVDDPTGRNLQVKAQAPENTRFFSGTGKDPCESSTVAVPPANTAPSSAADPAVPQVTYVLRCQDQNPTTELTASIGYGDFDYSFVVPLR